MFPQCHVTEQSEGLRQSADVCFPCSWPGCSTMSCHYPVLRHGKKRTRCCLSSYYQPQSVLGRAAPCRSGDITAMGSLCYCRAPARLCSLSWTTSSCQHPSTLRFKCLRQALRACFAHWMITATSSGLKETRRKLSWFRNLCSKRQRLIDVQRQHPSEAEPGPGAAGQARPKPTQAPGCRRTLSGCKHRPWP